MDKKKIGAGFAGALQKAADATKAAKLAVQDMAADAKQSREKKKADAQKAAAAKEIIAAAESEKGTAPVMKSIPFDRIGCRVPMPYRSIRQQRFLFQFQQSRNRTSSHRPS